jgi:hypothetical protein
LVAITVAIIPAAAATADQLGDVEAADQRHGGRADDDAGEEPPAGHARGTRAERGPRVGGRAAGLGVADAERGEGDRQRGRERQQGDPGQDRRGTGGLGGQRGEDQDARPEDRADVEGGGRAGGEHECIVSRNRGHLVLCCAR